MAQFSVKIMRLTGSVLGANQHYALSVEGQELGSEAGQLQVKANVNATPAEGSPDLDSINIIDYDFETYGDPELQGRLIARWTNEIFPVPRR